MWTTENRGRYDRSQLRYPSDLTDDEWNLVAPSIPPGKRGGDKRTVILREVVNGLMYILSTGCQWRAIPKDLPPRSTLYDYFDLWSWDGTLDLIHHELYVKCREAVSRAASPHGPEWSNDDWLLIDCKLARNNDPLRVDFASNSDPS